MEERCQSCGMPIKGNEEVLGTELDGSKSQDYCSFCYQKGEFIHEVEMEEMIDLLVPFMQEGFPEMSEDMCRKTMMGVLPNLKRWKK